MYFFKIDLVSHLYNVFNKKTSIRFISWPFVAFAPLWHFPSEARTQIGTPYYLSPEAGETAGAGSWGARHLTHCCRWLRHVNHW